MKCFQGIVLVFFATYIALGDSCAADGQSCTGIPGPGGCCNGCAQNISCRKYFGQKGLAHSYCLFWKCGREMGNATEFIKKDFDAMTPAQQADMKRKWHAALALNSHKEKAAQKG